MSAPQHGEYDPARGGFYSAVTTQWHRDPTKIGEVRTRREPTERERQEFAKTKMGNNGKAHFKPIPMLERLIQFRDSDRVDDRAKYEQLAAGGLRGELYHYEADKRAAVESGDWQPPAA